MEEGVGDADGVAVVPPESDVPVPKVKPLVAPNCGGVIDRTAPSPPMVPPAIKKKRLPSTIFSFTQPSEIQILHCGSDQPEFQRPWRPF